MISFIIVESYLAECLHPRTIVGGDGESTVIFVDDNAFNVFPGLVSDRAFNMVSLLAGQYWRPQ
jgi:hypothetical protein